MRKSVFMLSLALVFAGIYNMVTAVAQQPMPKFPYTQDAITGAITFQVDVGFVSGAIPGTLIAGLKIPVFYLEAYRFPTDPVGDDTLLFQRVCPVAAVQNGQIWLAGKTYVSGPFTAGDNGPPATELLGHVCHLIGSSPNIQIYGLVAGPYPGTTLQLKANSDASFITVPKEAPPMQIENMRIDGNKANQSATNCATANAAVIYMEDATGTTKRRGVDMRNVIVQNGCFDGVYAGLLRNAGYFDHFKILDSANRNAVWQSNNDWRWNAGDLGGSGKDNFLCNGCSSFKAELTNVFQAGGACALAVNCGRGIAIAATAGDMQWVGGDIARNVAEGVASSGGTDADGNRQARVFNGTKFFLNCLIPPAANCADVKATAETALSLQSTQHQKGTVASSGGAYPQFLIFADATSVVAASNNQFETDSHKPYTDPQPANGMNRVKGDLGISNTTVALDGTATPVVVDLCKSYAFTLTLTVNASMGLPTCIWPGKTYIFRITNSGGGHTLTWNAQYKGTIPALSAGVGATDLYRFVADATTTLVFTGATQNY